MIVAVIKIGKKKEIMIEIEIEMRKIDRET